MAQVQVRIPRVLQEYASGKAEFAVAGTTAADALKEIESRFPALHRCICDETGQVRQHIHVFVNDRLLIGDSGLKARLAAGDIVSVFQAVSGG